MADMTGLGIGEHRHVSNTVSIHANYARWNYWGGASRVVAVGHEPPTAPLEAFNIPDEALDGQRKLAGDD